MSKQRDLLAGRPGRRDNELAVEKTRVVRGDVSHIVQAREPTAHHSLRWRPVRGSDLGRDRVLQARVEPAELPQFQDLCKRPDRHLAVILLAKVCDEGMFLLDASGLKLKYDLLPSEAAKVPDYGKQADQVTRTVQKQNDNGVTYLSMVRKTIEANLPKFDQCAVVFINAASTGLGFEPYNTRGVLGL